jgi:hypothetical protein
MQSSLEICLKPQQLIHHHPLQQPLYLSICEHRKRHLEVLMIVDCEARNVDDSVSREPGPVQDKVKTVQASGQAWLSTSIAAPAWREQGIFCRQERYNRDGVRCGGGVDR